jgi:FkbM family methyltransferase
VRTLLINNQLKNEVATQYYDFGVTCQIPNLSMIFERYFPTYIGTFVEIGAYDGVTFSNTVGLARRGWKGILAEPDPSHFQSCAINLQDFQKCEVKNIAISSRNMKANLHRQGPLSTLSTDLHERYQTIDWAKGEADKGKIEVNCVTLDSLLTETKVDPEFELLVVDVEGHETEVFAGFSIEHWKPQMIILELADLHPDFPELEKVCLNLKDQIENHSYKVIYKDHINTIFISSRKYREKLLSINK